MVFFKKSKLLTKITNEYNTEEVIKQLEKDFHNKCYICESKEPISINIEHFVPHEGNPSLKFNWDNLFLACTHCNGIKSNNYKNIINCTNKEENVDKVIRYYCNPMPKEKAEIKPIAQDVKTLETVDLLDKCYNGTTPQKRLEAANIRSMLLKEIRIFQELLFEYEKYENETALEKIKFHLSNKSAFTAFKRWIIWDENEEIKKRYEKYIVD